MHHAERPGGPVAALLGHQRPSTEMRHLCPLIGYSEGREMSGVELYAAVRLAAVNGGLSYHEAGRRFAVDRRTVKKMVSYSAPSGYRRTVPVRRPKPGRVYRRHRRDPGGGPG